jgi:uncharacterized membrane protein YtjA (UPF0391 family)
MLWLLVVLLLIAVGAYLLGSSEIKNFALWAAKIVFVILIILIVISFILPGPYYWGWGPGPRY